MPAEKSRDSSGDQQKLDKLLCFAIYSANLAVHRLYRPLLDELGLTYPQYLVLLVLYEHGDQTVSGVGEKLFLDSSTLTPLLKRVERLGYLTRQRNPKDERQVRIHLTRKGRTVCEKCIAFRGGLLNATGLTPSAYGQLQAEVAKLRENLTAALRAEE
jgi:DNA-binding MarR family transcriptional regulator